MKLGRHSTAVPCDTQSRAASGSSVATQASLGKAAFGEYSMRVGARRAPTSTTSITSEALCMLHPPQLKHARMQGLRQKSALYVARVLLLLPAEPARASKAGIR